MSISFKKFFFSLSESHDLTVFIATSISVPDLLSSPLKTVPYCPIIQTTLLLNNGACLHMQILLIFITIIILHTIPRPSSVWTVSAELGTNKASSCRSARVWFIFLSFVPIEIIISKVNIIL